jgi:uncharacterized delta-60 repeat protein
MLASAQADPSNDGGALDPTFGTGGITTTPISELGYTYGDVTAVAVQPDGDVVVGGYLSTPYAPSANTGFALARYLPDGSLDPSFGNGGLVDTCVAQPIDCGPNLSSGDGTLDTVLAEPDGKLLAIGSGEHGLTFVRYNDDGSLDTTFGTGGISPDPSSPDYPPPVMNGAGPAVLQPDGKIVALVSGGIENGSSIGGGIARFNPDGTLDQSFGTDGVERPSWPSDTCTCRVYLESLALGPNGTIVLGGVYEDTTAGVDNPVYSWLAERYTSDGSPDSSFGSNGVAIVPDGGASAMAVLSDGKIVLGDEYDPWREIPGECCDSSSARLIRLNADGTLDTTFGTNGVEITTPANKSDGPALLNDYYLFAQPDGKVMALGEVGLAPASAGTGFGLERFMPDGSPDPSFGIDGVAGISFGSWYDAAMRAATVQPDGKILAVGSGWPSQAPPPGTTTPISLLLMRYLPDGSTPLAVSQSGTGTGTVDSQPLGIQCDGKFNCSAQFANQSDVTLTAHPSQGAQISWNGACAGHALTCRVTVNQATSHVQVTFSLCDVPRLHGKALSKAESAIRRNHCSVGRVTRKSSRTIARGFVISEKPGAGSAMPARTKVNLVVSKGT